MLGKEKEVEMLRRAFIGWVFAMGSMSLQAANESVFSTLTPEELERYQFDETETPYTVSELNIGQRYILDRHRTSAKDLMARHLGFSQFSGNLVDLERLQALVDRGVVKDADVSGWQALGVVFGDVLVRQHGLRWVVFEDEVGSSKALQWGKTDNFIFPVTVFSKRVQFNEAVEVEPLYRTLSKTIEEFKAYQSPPKLP